MNELMIMSDDTILVKQGTIEFPAFEQYKEDALAVAQLIMSVDVSEENIKQSKKLLAQVSKSVRNLEDRRISIKKELLIPYNELEVQVKEIVKIVKDADTIVRDQVKELEEIDRMYKRDELEDMWDKRITTYPFDFVTFEDFITPQHLNKSVTINKTEDEMVEFLERVNSDMTVINNLENKVEILVEYRECLDLSAAMNIVQMKKDRQKEAEKFLAVDENISEAEEYVFKVFNKKDMKLVKLILNENDIEYEEL